MSVLIFLLDWWLIRSRQNAEKKQAALTVGEVVNSIISLDKRKGTFSCKRFGDRMISLVKVLECKRFGDHRIICFSV